MKAVTSVVAHAPETTLFSFVAALAHLNVWTKPEMKRGGGCKCTRSLVRRLGSVCGIRRLNGRLRTQLSAPLGQRPS